MENKKIMENAVVETKKIDELRELGLEAYETNTDTMLEEMGASIGWNNCCSVVLPSVSVLK